MKNANKQLAIPLPSAPPDYSRSNFITCDPQNNALTLLDGWLESDEQFLVVNGAPGAGKTHLLSIAAKSLDATLISFSSIRAAKLEEDLKCLLVDNLEKNEDARALFELIEMARSGQNRLVLAGCGAPADWAAALPDLATRLEAMYRISLSEPDEPLMRAVMLKMFRDRQIGVAEAVIEYVAPRLPRTFQSAQAFVAAADLEGIETGRPISVSVAKKVLANLSEGALEAYLQ